VFDVSVILGLVADNPCPQRGSVLGAVYAERAQHRALLRGLGNIYRFRNRLTVVFSHRGLLECQI